MAIRIRRGNYEDFDPLKMVSGEFADIMSGDPNTSTGQAVYIATRAGQIRRVAFVEDVNGMVSNMTDDIVDQFNAGVASNVSRAETAATNAAASAADARQHTPVFTDANSDGNIVITIGSGS